MVAMGGTLLRLVEHGHDVHIVYQTSGNLTVSDEDALRFVDFAESFNVTMLPTGMVEKRHFQKIRAFLLEKNSVQADRFAVRGLKTLIRQGEARTACRYAGIRPENIHFLNMPFYETGMRSKLPLTDQDVKLNVDLLRQVKPHQIFAAGDLSDPHDTHRLCLDAIKAALKAVRRESWFKDCYVWFYRGAWEEWGIEQIDMAVPISPRSWSASATRSSSTRRRRTAPCSRAATSAMCGSGPRSATAERPASTTRWAWPSTRPSRRSCASCLRPPGRRPLFFLAAALGAGLGEQFFYLRLVLLQGQGSRERLGRLLQSPAPGRRGRSG